MQADLALSGAAGVQGRLSPRRQFERGRGAALGDAEEKAGAAIGMAPGLLEGKAQSA